MTDMEKVIKGLKCCVNDFGECEVCPYDEGNGKIACGKNLYSDALALLEAQEPRAVDVTAEINYRKIGNCPNCGKPINSGDYPNYCGQCGQAVKWE